MPAISTKKIVNSFPSVLIAGGKNLVLNGLLLTQSTRLPIGQVVSFATAADVIAVFGPTSLEAQLAGLYFLGFTISSKKPGALLMYQYNPGAVSAWLQSAQVSGMTLGQLQASGGSLVFPIDGVTRNATVDLGGVTSFSAAALKIQIALVAAGATGVTVIYDVITGSFFINSSTTGVNSTIGYGSGALATALGLTSAGGATLSQGAGGVNPVGAMNQVVAYTSNWGGFMTTFEPVASDKLLFASWVNSTNDQFYYACWDTDQQPAVTNNAASSVGAQIEFNQYSGVAMVYQDVNSAMMILGSVAAINFDELNGRATLAFKSTSGLTPIVTSRQISDNLDANGYNYYGRFADDAENVYNFLYAGSISGPFAWIDSYVNQMWMNAAFRTAIMTAFVSAKSIPYNQDGYSIMLAALMTPIRNAVDFGAIRAGVTLTDLQIAEVNSDAGADVAKTIQVAGWYLKIFDAPANVRAARGSPVCKFWYTDGESIQSFNINSIAIQ